MYIDVDFYVYICEQRFEKIGLEKFTILRVIWPALYNIFFTLVKNDQDSSKLFFFIHISSILCDSVKFDSFKRISLEANDTRGEIRTESIER